jgi:hypothetical protein
MRAAAADLRRRRAALEKADSIGYINTIKDVTVIDIANNICAPRSHRKDTFSIGWTRTANFNKVLVSLDSVNYDYRSHAARIIVAANNRRARAIRAIIDSQFCIVG